ncbi:MAG: hypothetical protein LAQ69_45440 [Acidobacteriia bacterium]|nr:hypothetical protein [Terriglobia bacterium]
MSAGSETPDPLRAALQRVLASECFCNSDTMRRLLSYMAARTLSHNVQELKEYTIGIELDGKPSSYDPQKDASIRVQIGRLRQKLEEYYQAEGSGDPYRLELPKGRFAILFHKNEGQQPSIAPARRAAQFTPVRIVLAAALVLLAASMSWTILLWRKVDMLETRVAAPQAAANRDFAALWSGFFNLAVPNMLVFGSPPFFASPKQGLFVRMYRYPDPNDPRSSPDFQGLEGKLGPLAGPRFDYASMGDAIGAQRLSEFFGSHRFALHALPAHLAVWETIQDDNLIFLGAPRMNPLLRRLPIQPDFEFGADEFIHNHNPHPGEQSVYETPSHRDTMSYAVIGCYPGLKPDREILVLMAHSTAGAVGIVDFVTSAEGVHVVRERLKIQPGEHRHFEVLLRVFSDNDAAVKTEYVAHHLVP